MQKRACTVFISSTAEDLKEFRAAARDAVLHMGLRPVMTEYFAASSRPPLRECLDRVTACDVVVAIVAERHGWTPPEQPHGAFKSITRLECEHATNTGKDVLAFLLDKKASWPAELRESYRVAVASEEGSDSPELLAEVKRNISSLRDFKQWLEKGRVRTTFTNPDDLRAKVISALHAWLPNDPDHSPDGKRSPDDPGLYLQWLREQTGTIDIRGLGVGSSRAHAFPIDDLYIPLSTSGQSVVSTPHRELREIAEELHKVVAGGGRGATQTDEQAGLNQKRERAESVAHMPVALEDALAYPRLVIVGDPGSGKTTFLRHFTYDLAGAALKKQSRSVLERCLSLLPLKMRELLSDYIQVLPILIRVADLSGHIRKCKDRTTYGGPVGETDPSWIIDFLNYQNDELHWTLDRRFFAQVMGSGAAIILLDGLDEAPDRIEREKLARLFERATQAYPHCRFVVTTRPRAYEGLSILQAFQVARIEPLEPHAIERFLEYWCRGLYPESPSIAKRHELGLSEALHKSREIRELARNPVMLTALAVVHWHERRLPEQRADLYDAILMWLSRSRETRQGREPAERCLGLLKELALAMQNGPEGRQVDLAIGEAAEILASEFTLTSERHRFERALTFLEQEMADSGIIVSRGGDVQFWHLTFQEYLAASAIAGRSESVQCQLLLRDKVIYLAEWREVALLLAGILRVKQGREKVDGLIASILNDLGSSPTLTEQARCAGLLGAIVRDLHPLSYQPRDERYRAVIDAVLGIFEAANARNVPFNVRLDAAEALGQAGDPRLGQFNWVRLDGGTFRIGDMSEDLLQLASFDIGTYPITIDEYRRFVDDDGYRDARWWSAGGWGKFVEPGAWEDQKQHPNRPVTYVSWYEATAYCAWAGLRLPTEVEWERAARGAERRPYPWGNQPPEPTRANYMQSGVAHPTPVGLYPDGATPEGIQDMAGNVLEWVSDREVGFLRVLRGGSWQNEAAHVRATSHFSFLPSARTGDTGFRCVRDFPSVPLSATGLRES